MTLQPTPLEGLPLFTPSTERVKTGKESKKVLIEKKMGPDAYGVGTHVMLGRLGRGPAGLPRERPNLKKPHATTRR